MHRLLATAESRTAELAKTLAIILADIVINQQTLPTCACGKPSRSLLSAPSDQMAGGRTFGSGLPQAAYRFGLSSELQPDLSRNCPGLLNVLGNTSGDRSAESMGGSDFVGKVLADDGYFPTTI